MLLICQQIVRTKQLSTLPALLFFCLLTSVSQTAQPSNRQGATSQTVPVPSSYFGLTVLNFQLVQPETPFGTSRSWDEYPSLDWAEVNSSPGVYNFSSIDAFIKLNQSRGKEMIYTFGRTPAWASSSPAAFSPYGPGQCAPPRKLTEWDNYVAAIVTHAAGRIHAWELWNEPNDPQFYCGDIPTLVKMASDAYRIIKTIDPAAEVLAPSVTSATGPYWLNSYLKAGGGKYADVMTFHGYWGPHAESIQSVIQNYRLVLAANGQSEKPLWDTEASWDGDPSNLPQGDLNRAAFLAKYYLLQWPYGVSRMVWYAYDGDVRGGMWDSTNGLHADGVAYRVVLRWMVGARMDTPCTEDNNGTWTCHLLRNGNHAEVIWNSTAVTLLQIANEYTQETDLMGITKPLIGSTITVGNSPTLFCTGKSF